jgi:hypothetical protein
VNNKKWRKWSSLFKLTYLITLMAYLCSQWTPSVRIKYFMFDWLIYRLFVLNSAWKLDPLQIKIFVFVSSTRSIVELKTRFETWITWNVVNGASLFHLSYLITLMTYLCSQRTPNVQITFFMIDWPIYRIFVLNTCWKRDSIQMIIFANICSSWSMVELKTRFYTWLTRNDVNDVSLFHLSYITTLMAYLCSQRTPNIQIMYFMFHWCIYRLFVLNTSWKRDSLQMMKFLYVCSTWDIVELRTRFETWITWNDVNDISLFHLS